MTFVDFSMVIGLLLLIWSCIEVGSNDAANLVNAVFGSRVLERKVAVYIAGAAVVLGATFSSPVVETVRKGIFDMSHLDANMAIAVFLASYLVGTVLLYSYSAYGLPVSSTATLVFSLAGGAIGASESVSGVNWPRLGMVACAIFVSIFLSGLASFLAQRIFRGAIRKDAQKHDLVLLHGPWIAGLMLVSLVWFMVVKGMRYVPTIGEFHHVLLDQMGTAGFLFLLWGGLTLMIHLLLVLTGRKGTQYLFHGTTILGMICMSFAFGQNDLANCASPGLGILMIWTQGLEGSEMSIPTWLLSCCGILIFLGMTTKRAQRVTRAEMNTASQQNKVRLYAPQWCCRLAQFFLKDKTYDEDIREIAPTASRNEEGKKLHYDTLRASVILSVGACIIALASSLGLPVSTTYVAFAAVVATGWGDRVFTRGNSSLKLGRAIWVVTGWIMGGLIAFVVCGLAAMAIHRWHFAGIGTALVLNLSLRHYYHKKAEAQEQAYHGS